MAGPKSAKKKNAKVGSAALGTGESTGTFEISADFAPRFSQITPRTE
jgi:hypothetical protein